MTLIIGASGYVGSALFDACTMRGDDVVGTYSRDHGGRPLARFDLACDDIRPLADRTGGGSNKIAVICAAISKISTCRSDNDRARAVNVTGTKRTIDSLCEMGWRVIFLSSDNVFGGERGDRSDDDKQAPVNEYGRMKAEIETYMINEHPDSCVFRLSKVIGDMDHPHDMLREWKTQALAGETIRCIRGNIFNPVYVGDVTECVELAQRHKLSGIYNICGDRKESRAELCRDFLSITGLSADIKEESLDAFGFADTRPLDTSMLNAKFKERTGYQFTPYEEICGRYR